MGVCRGCGVVALGSDVPRVGGGAQEAYRVQVERYIALLTSMLGGDERVFSSRPTRALLFSPTGMAPARPDASATLKTKRTFPLMREVVPV